MRRLNWAGLIGAILAAFSLNTPPSTPPVESTPPSEVTWTVVFRRAPPPASRPPGGSRGEADQVYPIAPGQIGRTELWSDRPLFVWQGAIRQLEVTDAAGALFWSQAVAAEDRSIRYSGAPLQPGQTYEWIIYNLAKAAIARVSFQVMTATERDQIAADLETLTAQYSQAMPEQMALQRANYFADRQLWADVLREAFSVTDPSEELVSVLRQFGNAHILHHSLEE